MYAQGSRVAGRIAMVAIVAGVVVRIWAYAGRGSLWLDEASLALNVLGRSPGGLATPLDWGQAAPLGFLWIEKLLTAILGAGEWVLRLWPAVAGILTVPLMWMVGRRVVGERAAALATVAVAASLIAIRYGTEAKPYSSDAFFALILAWLALDVRAEPSSAPRRRTLIVAALIAVLCSLPSVFVLVGVALMLRPAVRTIGGAARRDALVGVAVCLALFGALWLAVYRAGARDPYLAEYWAPVMLTPGTKDFGARLVRAGVSIASTPLQWTGAFVASIGCMDAWLCGYITVGRKSRDLLALLGGPILAAALASVFHAYPLSDRLAFFAVPFAMMVTGAATVWLIERWLPSIANIAMVATALIAGAWIASDSWRLIKAPGQLEPTRELFRAVNEEAARAHASVYVAARAAPAWIYATTDWRSADRRRFDTYRVITGPTTSPAHENFAGPDTVLPVADQAFAVMVADRAEIVGLAPGVRYRIAGPTSRDGPSAGWAEQEAGRVIGLAEHGDAWIVASHFFEGTPRDELRPLVNALVAGGAQIVEERRGGRDAVALKVRKSARVQSRTTTRPR